MRVLIAHNHYQQYGGEDAVVKAEAALLESFNDEIYLYERSNAETQTGSKFSQIGHLFSLGWSSRSYKDITKIIKIFKPDVAHFHNIFFMLTPAVYQACRDMKVPVVQSQHNFRPFCSNALFLRNGNICEDCMTKGYFQGVIHGCYKDSRLVTAFVANVLARERKKKTWQRMIDSYIVASEFTKQKYIQYGGISHQKIHVKPNFVYPDPGKRSSYQNYALYVGRLSQEKGVGVLIDAWRSVSDLPLKIIGDGPLASPLKTQAQGIPNIEFLNHVPSQALENYIKGAKFLIVPSICYENFPRIVAESFGCGVPVVASRLGSLAELINDGKNGLLVKPNDPVDLAEKVNWLKSRDNEIKNMGDAAFRDHQNKYQMQVNYKKLKEIYHNTIQNYSH